MRTDGWHGERCETLFIVYKGIYSERHFNFSAKAEQENRRRQTSQFVARCWIKERLVRTDGHSAWIIGEGLIRRKMIHTAKP